VCCFVVGFGDDDAIKLALVPFHAPQALPHLPTRMPLVLVVVMRVIAAHLRLCGHQSAWASPLTSYPSCSPSHNTGIHPTQAHKPLPSCSTRPCSYTVSVAGPYPWPGPSTHHPGCLPFVIHLPLPSPTPLPLLPQAPAPSSPTTVPVASSSSPAALPVSGNLLLLHHPSVAFPPISLSWAFVPLVARRITTLH